VLFDVYGTLFVSARGEPAAPAVHPSGTQGQPDGPLAAAFAALRMAIPAATAAKADPMLQTIIRDHHARARAVGVDFPEVDIVSVFQELLRRLGAAAGRRLPCGRDAARRLALEHELRGNPSWPMPDARATLRALRDRGLLRGIVSNSQCYTPWLFPALMGAELSALGFRASLCAWSYRCGCAKPSPSLFLGPLRELQRRGLPPSAVLVVGNDRGNDILPAALLGCRTALLAADARSYWPRTRPVRAGQGPVARLRGPDLRLTALAQLPELLS